jgi:hypothetical protein
VRHVRQALPFALALGAFALAALSAYAAREAGRVDTDLRRSDAAFQVEPRQSELWAVDSSLPGLDALLGTDDDVDFRRGARMFELLRLGGPDPFNSSTRATRADAQLALARAQESGLTARGRSKAANFEGVLVLEDAVGDQRNGRALINASLEHFRRAIDLDAANQEAPYNLELLLKLLQPDRQRLAARHGVSIGGRDDAGAAALGKGHGY